MTVPHPFIPRKRRFIPIPQMGFSSNPITTTAAFFIALSLLSVRTNAHIRSLEDEGFISMSLSSKGLGFVKDLLVQGALSFMTPLDLQPIEKTVKIPLVGRVDIALSDITVYRVGVGSSYVSSGENGVVIVASGGTANLTMNWKYSYDTWLFPISDKGAASVQVFAKASSFGLCFKVGLHLIFFF